MKYKIAILLLPLAFSINCAQKVGFEASTVDSMKIGAPSGPPPMQAPIEVVSPVVIALPDDAPAVVAPPVNEPNAKMEIVYCMYNFAGFAQGTNFYPGSTEKCLSYFGSRPVDQDGNGSDPLSFSIHHGSVGEDEDVNFVSPSDFNTNEFRFAGGCMLVDQTGVPRFSANLNIDSLNEAEPVCRKFCQQYEDRAGVADPTCEVNALDPHDYSKSLRKQLAF